MIICSEVVDICNFFEFFFFLSFLGNKMLKSKYELIKEQQKNFNTEILFC